MDATAKFVAIIAVAAFATERILAAINYLMNAVRLAQVRSGGATRLRARERRKLLLAAIAAVIAYVVVDRANLRLLNVLQVANVPGAVDFWLTWLVVVAGADRVHEMLGTSGGGNDASERSDTPVVRVRIDGGEVRELHRVG
jgi:hypothetical protein